MHAGNSTSTLLGPFRQLMVMGLAVYLSVAGLIGWATLESWRESLHDAHAMLAQGARTTLTAHERLLRGLGQELRDCGALEHPERGRALLERVRRMHPGLVSVELARPDGQPILVSPGGADRPDPERSEQPGTRGLFDTACLTPRLCIGRPHPDAPLGKWVVPIRLAIRDAEDRRRAVITATYPIDEAVVAWNPLALPRGVTVTLVREDGFRVYHQPSASDPPGAARRATYGQPVAESLRQRLDHPVPSTGVIQASPQANERHLLAYGPVAGYDVQAWATIPRRQILADWRQRLIGPTALFLVFLGLSGWGYVRASRRQSCSNAEVRRLTSWQRAMLESAEYSIISTEPDGRIVSFNRAAQQLLGYTPDEVIGKLTPAAFHDARELAQRAWALSRAHGTPIPADFTVLIHEVEPARNDERDWTYIAKDGTRHPVRVSLSTLYAMDEGVIGYLAIAADRSEQHTIQADLRDSEARYRSLFEHSADAVFLMRGEYFVECNPASLRLFGCSREALIGATPAAYSPSHQPDGSPSREKALAMLNQARQGTLLFEWQHQRLDGTRIDTEVNLNALILGGQRYQLATVRDITPRKRAEAKLARSRRAVIRRNEGLNLLIGLTQRLHGSQSVDEILAMTLEALRGLSQTPHVAIYLLAGDHKTLQRRASQGFGDRLDEFGGTLPMHGSLSGRSLELGKLMIIRDVGTDARLDLRVRPLLIAQGIRSGAIIPLVFQDRALGTLNLWFSERRAFGRGERETLTSLSRTVALALSNADHLERLAFQSRHDTLTGLPNRLHLHEVFAAGVGSGRVTEAALLLLDLDHFKAVNDTLGHHIGDRLLSDVGQRLRDASAPQGPLVARLGGDEFAILLQGQNGVVAAQPLAAVIVEALRRPFAIEGLQVSVGASIGVAYCPTDGEDSHALLRAADVAMYRAKRQALGIVVYDRRFDHYSKERLAFGSELVEALEQAQIRLHYQPKVAIATGAVTGFEALVRWQHPRHGLLYPDAFLDRVEMSEVIHPLTEAVIETAVADKRRLARLGFDQPVAINLSARNLVDTRCLDTLIRSIERHRVPPQQIEIELTETVLMQDSASGAALLERFVERGITIVIDDFGTGYSSLAYLRKLPLDRLKIDRTFVQNMRFNDPDRTIVRSIINLAHNLGLGVVAEGVEDDATFALLAELRCDEAQGFGLCRPCPRPELETWLQTDHRPTRSG